MTFSNQTSGHIDAIRLNAFIDGELDPHEEQELQQHLADCHRCTLGVLAAMRLKSATARSKERFAASPEILSRLAAHLRSQEQKATIQFRPKQKLVWTAVAAGLVIALATAGGLQLRQSNALSAELLDQHLATLSSAASPEVLSTDRHTVKPWFQGKLPFSFNLPDRLPADTLLKGADLAYLNGQPAALLQFTIRKHEVSVFLAQRSTSPIAAGRFSYQSGFALCHATTQDLTIVAVSDINTNDLDVLLSAMVQAQASQ